MKAALLADWAVALQTWHWNEKRRIGQYYADLARKELEEESERQKAFKAKLAELEQLLA